MSEELRKALAHAVAITEGKEPGTWDDLLQYRELCKPAQKHVSESTEVKLKRRTPEERDFHFTSKIMDLSWTIKAAVDILEHNCPRDASAAIALLKHGMEKAGLRMVCQTTPVPAQKHGSDA